MSKHNGNNDWEPRFLRLPVHKVIEHQMRLCMDGVESALVIGPRGAGKTAAVRRLIKDVEAEEVDRLAVNEEYELRRVLYFEASAATGTKTILINVYEQLFGHFSSSALRFQTAKNLVRQISQQVQTEGIHLICVDEAQMIDPKNLDLLRQIPDAAQANGHPMGLLLVGSEELRDSLSEIKQLGQRFSAEIKMKPLSKKQLEQVLADFHPDLGPLQEKLSKRDWNKLVTELAKIGATKMRRLVTVLKNAHALAAKKGQPIDEKIMYAAIRKLAGEV